MRIRACVRACLCACVRVCVRVQAMETHSMFLTVIYDDLYNFRPDTNTWTALLPLGKPSPRWGAGFAAAPDGLVYAFGGTNGTSKCAGFVAHFTRPVESRQLHRHSRLRFYNS